MDSRRAVLLIGFGGPMSLAEVRTFLESVTEGAQIPEERLREVYRHYEQVGGVSPYNTMSYRQKEALEIELKKRGCDWPVFLGFRHSKPEFRDCFLELKKKNIREVSCFVLSSFRSHASFEKYQEKVLEAQKAMDALTIELRYAKPFHTQPLFIDAWMFKIEELLRKNPELVQEETYFLFTVHSIPQRMSDVSAYATQFVESSRLISEKLGLQNWNCVYQSRSGSPRDPWLGPDVNDAIRSLTGGPTKNAVLVPLGFLCENVEILYDLDMEARDSAEKVGLKYFRVSAVNEDARFIQLMADLVLCA